MQPLPKPKLSAVLEIYQHSTQFSPILRRHNSEVPKREANYRKKSLKKIGHGGNYLSKHAGVHEKGTFSLSDLMEKVKNNEKAAKAGAVTLFIGIVRGETLEERNTVQKIIIDAYEEKANEILEGICEELLKKPGITDVQIHHMIGEFDVGEELVYVSVSGGHRKDVFPVLEEAVERYKAETPIFKKERITDSKGRITEYWISEKNHTQ
jgi:molybdopterin synthase catalytic subunit